MFFSTENEYFHNVSSDMHASGKEDVSKVAIP